MSIRRFFHRTSEDNDLAQELESHIAHEIDENVARGVPEAEARRRAYLKFGNPIQVREDIWRWNTMEFLDSLWRDLRFAFHTMRHRPGFVAVVLLTLALDTGATTVMFALINGVLFKPLPFPDAGRLVAVHGYSNDWNVQLYGQQNVANPDFRDCKNQSHTLDIAGQVYDNGTVSLPGEPEYVDVRNISSNLFSVLGIDLAHGRAFLPEEDQPGAAPVMIIGNSFWQRHFGGTLAAIGSAVILDTKSYTVVGIAPAGLKLPDSAPDVMIPLGQNTAKYLQNRRAHPVMVIARLLPRATLAQAQTELALMGRHLAEQYPDTNKGRTFQVKPLRPEVANVGSALWLLLGAVGLVLLIACANVASLLLARAVSREREFALRVALGAGRGRLVRQCLTESTILGLAGGALGVLVAFFGIHPFVRFWPGALPRAEEAHLDWHVLLFALGISLLSGLLFGLAPALRAPARNLEQVLRAGSRMLAGSSRRLHGVFVISELALAIVLLVSAGMLGRTLLRLASLDPGVDIHNVLTARVALSPVTLQDAARTRTAWKEILDHVSHLPGIQAIAMADTVPFRRGNNPLDFWPTPALPPEGKRPLTLASSVTPDYLKVMSIRLLQGRFIDDQDQPGKPFSVVIDDVMAQQAFGGKDAVGKLLWMPDMGSQPVKVVGVVGHVRYWGLAGDDKSQVRAQLYYSFAQIPDQWVRRWSELMSIAVRTQVPPLNMVEMLRHEVRGTTGDQVIYKVHTMEDLVSASIAEQRFLLLLFGIFAGLALLLACIGIYGVLSYLTSQRVPEIGIRMALGASAANVLGLILRQSLAMIAMGASLGVIAALAAGRLLLHMVDGMRPTDPVTVVAMIAVLFVAALLASFIPARRASRLDAVQALRSE